MVSRIDGSTAGVAAPSRPMTGQQLAGQYMDQLDTLRKSLNTQQTPAQTKGVRQAIAATVGQLVDLQLNDLKKTKSDLDGLKKHNAPAADIQAKTQELTNKANQAFGSLTGTVSGLRGASYDRGADENGNLRPQTDQINPSADLKDAMKVAQHGADEARKFIPQAPTGSGSRGWSPN